MLHFYTLCVAETLVCTLDLMHVLFPYHVILNPRSLHVDTSPSVPTLTTSYVHGTSSHSLLHQTVGQSLDYTAQRWPDREAVVFLEDGIRKTFSQFQQDVCVWLSGARVFSHSACLACFRPAGNETNGVPRAICFVNSYCSASAHYVWPDDTN